MVARTILFVFLLPAFGLAQVPNTISFQGSLADSSTGIPTNGTVGMLLSLHTLAVGGSTSGLSRNRPWKLKTASSMWF
jgi:hypothetical protein